MASHDGSSLRVRFRGPSLAWVTTGTDVEPRAGCPIEIRLSICVAATEALVRKIWPVAAVLAVPTVLALIFFAWLAAALWEYDHSPGAVLAHHFEGIEQGM